MPNLFLKWKEASYHIESHWWTQLEGPGAENHHDQVVAPVTRGWFPLIVGSTVKLISVSVWTDATMPSALRHSPLPASSLGC